MASIKALLEGQEFESIEEINAFLQDLLKDGGPLPPPPAETPLEEAQAVMYRAYEARGRQRVKLARKALSISPDCADAYVLLAEEEAQSLEEANAYYEQGVQAGRRALGPEVFQEQAGHFWGIVETRPFMRALEGYSRTLWSLGDREASVAQQEEMLRLNPGDNQGIRYALIHCLLDLDRLGDVERLFREYDREPTAHFTYPRALATFLKEGASARANRHLRTAFEANTHVPAYLLAEKRMPGRLPDSYSLGHESEAILYTHIFGSYWQVAAGALEWLRGMRGQVPVHKPEEQVEPLHLLELDMFDDDWDLVDTFDGFPPFRLDGFLADGQFPETEHNTIRRCLAVGLEKYYRDVYGYDKHGKQPAYLIDDTLHRPYLFGYGALEIIRHKRLRPASKMAVCDYAVNAMQIDAEEGVPYGILTLLGYMATQEALEYGKLLEAVIGLGFNVSNSFAWPNWLEGAKQSEMLALVDWIAASDDIPVDEKLWWAWKLGIQSGKRQSVGKAMAIRWLSLDALSTRARLTLCHSWLTRKGEVGTPPLIWQFNSAMSAGQFGEAKRLIQEHGLEVEPELSEMLAEVEREYVEAEPSGAAGLVTSYHAWYIVPPYLHRLAIPALVRLGEDLEQTIEVYWQADSDYYKDANTAGVADAIREFSERLSPARRRELIERGVTHGSAQTRKAFYLLSEELYGDEYLERALQDNAASLRTWAAKKLAKRA